MAILGLPTFSTTNALSSNLPSLNPGRRFATMHVQIALEAPHTTWTNLDFIRGKVVLRLYSATPISSIVVKLEGESRTRLRALPRAHSSTGASGGAGMSVGGGRAEDDWVGEKPIIREELHKILYRTSTVFPEIPLEKMSPQQRHYTLPVGQHEYPFVFKVPFNNSCSESNPASSNSLAQLAGLTKGVTLSATHVKKTLPPTLTALPGLAEVRYYLKATVKRKEFYKENPRVIQNLNFLPIEPPRPADTGSETYARRQHHFVAIDASTGKPKKNLFNAFRKNSSGEGNSAETKIGPPVISVDARLPSPAILTCNEDVPLRILVRRINDNADQLYLETLHIQLSGNTRVKAGEILRDEASNWIILSKSNMGIPLYSRKGSMGQEADELIIEAGAWRNKPLPNTVAPSFETCNIVRKYELEVHVGIGYGAPHSKNAAIIPLHHPVQVYSGITPPPALLAAMANAKTMPSRKPIPANGTQRPPEKTAAYTAPSHLQGAAATSYAADSAIPSTSQAGPSNPPPSQQLGPVSPEEEEPPPSYEDAIAEDLPPLDGPRRDYNPPPMAEGNRGFSAEKRGRRDS